MKLGFISALTILFIALKLCNVIAWSWWLVLLPMWILIVFWSLVITVVIIGETALGTSRKR